MHLNSPFHRVNFTLQTTAQIQLQPQHSFGFPSAQHQHQLQFQHQPRWHLPSCQTASAFGFRPCANNSVNVGVAAAYAQQWHLWQHHSAPITALPVLRLQLHQQLASSTAAISLTFNAACLIHSGSFLNFCGIDRQQQQYLRFSHRQQCLSNATLEQCSASTQPSVQCRRQATSAITPSHHQRCFAIVQHVFSAIGNAYHFRVACSNCNVCCSTSAPRPLQLLQHHDSNSCNRFAGR